MLIELLRPTGPELARRWLAALMLVPEREREEVVAAIEKKIVATYLPGDGLEREPRATKLAAWREVRVVTAPVQREGYVEHVERLFEVVVAGEKAKAKPKRRAK